MVMSDSVILLKVYNDKNYLEVTSGSFEQWLLHGELGGGGSDVWIDFTPHLIWFIIE